MSAQWMAAHLATKADFHTMPLALRQYSTFGHLLNYKGTSLALTKVDEADDGGEGKKESERVDGEEGEGDGGVTRQRYTIGSGQREWRFETVPKSGLPARHPYRRTYDPHNPPIGCRDVLFPSFTAFIRRMALLEWYNQGGVGEKEVFEAREGDGFERYRSLLTGPIDDHKTVDCIWEPNDERERFIILKGMKEGDAVVAYLWVDSDRITLYTTEAELEGHTRLSDRFPIAMSLARTLLKEHGFQCIEVTDSNQSDTVCVLVLRPAPS
ncbi:unnamed protein product [Vitrella brassicaformis CCMP3155]|uniref:Uncharacterized protein n=1 Tax=Vitrella brassicaformis (strain CCMP3155) TaxID=1169540 RepID=A0A0G4FPW1_VITBC|nr:unnamed protein product [Vitrella brassicaformis CCMP3155]|eukprot:CEM15819.1 unnamed protein product [Vitrella brassicaformis CCMP3155]